MLTLFSIPRPFLGHYGVIQRNAIKSWTLLRPKPEIILLGTDEGTEAVAREFGLKHVPDIVYNESGKPQLDSIHREAELAANHPLLCIVNADIILMNNFMHAVEQVAQHKSQFIMVGQRWNLDVTDSLNFEGTWENNLEQRLATAGRLGPRTGEDYIIYPTGFLEDVPPFVVGHSYCDGWLLFTARRRGLDLIDATAMVTAVHQTHDYSHIQRGPRGHVIDPQTKRNEELAGGSSRMLIIKDRTHVLTPKGIKPARDCWRLWRMLRTAAVLHPTLPIPIRLALKIVNWAINQGGQVMVWFKMVQPRRGPRYG